MLVYHLNFKQTIYACFYIKFEHLKRELKKTSLALKCTIFEVKKNWKQKEWEWDDNNKSSFVL